MLVVLEYSHILEDIRAAGTLIKPCLGKKPDLGKNRFLVQKPVVAVQPEFPDRIAAGVIHAQLSYYIRKALKPLLLALLRDGCVHHPTEFVAQSLCLLLLFCFWNAQKLIHRHRKDVANRGQKLDIRVSGAILPS